MGIRAGAAINGPSDGAIAGLPSRGKALAERRATLTVYAMLIGFLLVVAALGEVGVGAVRMLFILGCVTVAYVAYRTGSLALHVEVVIPLFVFAPFLRRLIDLHTGYEPSGMMLVGPLAALGVALPELRGLMSGRGQKLAPFTPYLLMTACLTYGWALSAVANAFLPSTITAAKYGLPMLYCMCLMLRPDQSDRVLNSAARAFLVVSPIIGLYGIYQHLYPPAWDQYWMTQSKMVSIGQPLPGQVRVFGTMNSPVSFAAYATCGLLLFSFIRRSFIPPLLVPVVALLPLSLALLLTEVRSAWISAAVSLAFCLSFKRTRSRAGVLTVCLGLGIAFALLFTSFGDSVGERLGSMNAGVSDDGSGYERMHDYMYVFTESDRFLFGIGLAGATDPRMAAMDGQLLQSGVQMGTVIGLVYCLAMLWAGGQALLTLRRDDGVMRLVAGSWILGELAIFLLTAISIGESGFLFWMRVGVITAKPRPPGDGRRRVVQDRLLGRAA